MGKNITVGTTVLANYYQKRSSLVGNLTYAVNGKLYFGQTEMIWNSLTPLAKRSVAMAYNQIVSVAKKDILMLAPTGLVVTMANGTQHTLVVNNRENVYQFIHSKIGGGQAWQPPAPAAAPQEPTGGTYAGPKPYIFISYAHADAAVVLPIVTKLQEQGFRVWFDQGIEAGTEWPEYIAEHLEKAGSVIIFMSKAAAASKNCRREINFAIDANKEMLVAYLEEVELSAGLKLQLNTLQAIFKYHSRSESEFSQSLCGARLIQHCRDAQVPTIYCTRCGTKNLGSSAFCGHCGGKL